MASVFKNSAKRKHEKSGNKFRLPILAWLSYFIIATLILSSISLARYTATSSENDSARIANFSVSATMQDVQNNNISLSDGEKCQFEVTNNSEVSVIYKVVINNLPGGVVARLTVGEKSIPIASDPKNTNKLISAEKVLEANNMDVCTLLFTAPDEVSGSHSISVQVQFEQAN